MLITGARFKCACIELKTSRGLHIKDFTLTSLKLFNVFDAIYSFLNPRHSTCHPRLFTRDPRQIHSIAKHFLAWTDITYDKEILANVKGMTIDLSETPYQHYFHPTVFTQTELA